MKYLDTVTWLYVIGIVVVIVLADRGDLVHWVYYFSRFVPYFDKVAHFLLMGMLALLVNLSLGCRCIQLPWVSYKILLGSLVVMILALGEEISQHFIPVRTFDWGDLVADVLGIVVFGQLAWQWQRYKNRQPQHA